MQRCCGSWRVPSVTITPCITGKGDKKTRLGKLTKGTFGSSHPTA
ncbi:30S ribosomal protein THX [Hymenobacter jeollabukensis]|uniref:30S ribosomal protein THX n=1 Tax=Hymenobacter jeollabukensis TaxID=2025313 RepID=A0A5R8WVP7_9BACT|nr:30S ribosomal protein THX [Hymenobacter jeollabukensis]